MSIEYDKNQHSVFLLQYHLILVVKYRKKVITKLMEKRLKEIFEYICSNKQFKLTLLELNTDKDHVHIIFKAKPYSDICKFINCYKSATSRLFKKEFPNIKKQLWKEAFWSRSYFLCTTGEVTLEVLKKYVQNQGLKDNRPKDANVYYYSKQYGEL